MSRRLTGRPGFPRTLVAHETRLLRLRAHRPPPPWLAVDDGDGLVETPWRALCPRRVLELRDPSPRTLRTLPPGTEVALVSDRPFGSRHLRRRARRAGVVVSRELIVVPTTTSPLVVLDATEEAVGHFWSSVAAVPPGVTWASAPATVALLLARVLPWRWTTALVPGRVLVGTRQ
ncbi:MAG: hypothetical protein ABI776_00040 [Nocardioidaceae bacterium]